MDKITTEWIERVLYRRLDKMGRKCIFPHVTPIGWWECDMFSMTGRGYWSEHEIKTSRGDYLNDFKKEMAILYGRRRSSRYCGQKGVDTLNKHELLAAGDPRGPSHFWFCMPEGMVDPSEVPDYAGIMTFPLPGSDNPSPHYMKYWRVERKAPRLHSEPFGEDREGKLHTQIPYRYQRAYFETVPKLRREIRELKRRLRERR